MAGRSYAYNTRKKTPEQLEKELVGSERWDVLNGILSELSLKKGEHPKQHWMIVGPRGIGKSHLLTLLYHKINNKPKLTKKWITVLFPEELRMANNLAKFLERTVNEILLELEKEESPFTKELQQEIEKIKEIRASERIEHLFSILNWINQSSGKFILLIIENLQQLLGKKISIIEQKKLRAFLQTNDNVLLIGSATTVFNALHDHKHPFYHFFHIRRLTDLNFEEMKTLVVKILTDDNRENMANKVAENEARMRAIYSFTGGNPRMAVFLSDILKTEVPDEMIEFMDEILEDLTPYFQAILNDTPLYMEEILNTLALYEPAQSPKEIAGHLEMAQTTIRNYLKQMKENGYVRIVFSKGKSNYYCLNEYLYRIWYQMRDSSHREETRWLMELLMMLYSSKAIMEERSKLNKCSIEEISANSYKKLIFETVDFIDKHPNYYKVIEWCVDSSLGENESTNKKWLMTKIKETEKLIDNRQFDRAIGICQEILKRNPKSESAYGNWGTCLIMQKRYDEAIEKFKKVLEINPNSQNAYLNWGICCKKQGRYDEAIKTLKKSLEIAPTSEDAFWHLGYCLMPSKQYDEAIDNFKKALEIDPNCAEAYGTWGDCLRYKELYQEAYEQYQKAVEIDPNYSDAYKNWGYGLYIQKRYKEAEKKYEKALEVNPQSSNAYELWGSCLADQGNYEAAIEKIKKSLEIDPNSEIAYSYWGYCLCDLKRYDEAIEKFETILDFAPESEKGFYGLVYCLYKAKRYMDVIQVMGKKEVDPIDNCGTILIFGNTLYESKRYSEAAEQFKKLLTIYNDCSKVYISYGKTLAKLGDREAALLSYLAHISIMSDNSHVCTEFLDIYKQYIKPILPTLNSEGYIKQIYSQADNMKFTMPQICTLLLLLDRSDIVADQLKSFDFIGKDDKERFDFDVMIFSIKFKLWLILTKGKMYEALKLVELFSSYVKLLKTEKEKEDTMSKFLLGIFKLQVHLNVESDYTFQLLERLKKAGVPFNDLFFKVWTCLSDPDSVDAQRYLSDKAIAELIEQVKRKDEPSDSACK